MRKSKKGTKMHQKHFLFKIRIFSNVIDKLKYYVVQIFFLFLIFCPLEFFENRTFKWVAFIGFWIKIFFLNFLNSFCTLGNHKEHDFSQYPKSTHPNADPDPKNV